MRQATTAPSTSSPRPARARIHARRDLIALAVTLALLLAWPGRGASSLDGNRLVVTPEVDYLFAQLSVAGPDERVYREHFDGDAPIVLPLADERGAPLADGRYRWTVKLVLEPAVDGADDAAGHPAIERLSGRFTIEHGAPRADRPEESLPAVADAPSELVENHFFGDLGADGEFCIGCGSGFEAGIDSGGSSLNVIDTTPSIAFLTAQDGSDLGDSAWEIGTDGASSGELFISPLDVFGGSTKRPVSIDHAATDDSIVVGTFNRVGLGTDVPRANLHLANFPADIFFEGIFADWLVGVTSGDLTFTRIRPPFGAPVLTLEHDNGGATPTGAGVGIFRNDPRAPLHVGSPRDGSAQVLVEELASESARRQLFRLENNGPPEFAIVDTNLDVLWKFATRGGNFEINRGGTGRTEMIVRSNGNLDIAGTLNQGSSRASKRNIIAVDGRQILEQVRALSLNEWSYTESPDEERHLGPMAEDFRAAFGLGNRDDRLAPGDTAGIALAAIQGLSEIVEERDRTIERMQAELDELGRRLDATDR